MSVNTLPKASTFAFGSGFGFSPVMFKKDSGALVIQKAAVFRSGTFRDSTGVQSTWESIHIKQMVDNYDHLVSSGIFTDVPVRDGHSGWLIHNMPGNGNVVGYHTKLWTEKLVAPHDGSTYDYLLADFEITDPAAIQKIDEGTWRNRSAEISSYVTNSEAEFWPVYMGVAYVDIPAVEGLKFSASDPGVTDRRVFVFMDKEMGVATDTTTTVQPAAVPAPAPLLGVTPPPATFSINGQATTDPVAVQAHITTLEKFRAETAELNRSNFVSDLAKAGKILATQIDGLTVFAKSLSDEQFVEWGKTYEAAPASSLVANHGGAVSNPDNTAQNQTSQADAKFADDAEIVKMHQRAGTPVDKIKQTGSYKRLAAANKAPAL